MPRAQLLAEYTQARGRISTTEAAALLHTSPATARALLDDLERTGALRPGRAQRRGRGFYYLPA